MSKIIGIDLGTTNSCVAIMEAGEVVIITNNEGSRTTPSAVYFDSNGERTIGQLAKRQAVVSPERTVLSIKRDMGLNRIVEIDDKTYHPQEISAFILQKLKEDAETYVGEEIKDAVITVPAYFNDAQRQATKDAGRIAGLNVQRIINEPTAAALAYGADKSNARRVLVYDFGGGTFDISILELNKGIFEVLATKGNNRLGGDDIDQRLIDSLLNRFQKDYGIDLHEDKSALQRIREAAEKAKIELSTMMQTKINLPYLSANATGPKHMEYDLTRAEFENLFRDLVEETIDLLKETVAESGLNSEDIDRVLLVGGSTRIPLVREEIANATGKDPYKGINPDECVAAGAAIQGGIIVGTVSDLLLLDVTPLSLGIETQGGIFTKLIERNTTIPIRKSRTFSTVVSDQTSVEVHVLQGERPQAAFNKTLGRFILTDIPPAPRGIPQIEVSFDIDVNGIVNVSARDISTNNEQKITIEASGNLSEEEIRKAIDDAKKYQEEDEVRKEDVRTLNEAQNLINLANRTMLTHGDSISEKDLNDIKERIADLDEMIRNEQYKEMVYRIAELRTILNKVSESMFKAGVVGENALEEEEKLDRLDEE